MGLQISQLIPKKEITLEHLRGKIIAVDSFNMLYQFLTTIRQLDGSPLMDSKGNITSHLVGLFYRTTNLMSKGIKLVFVFDGKKPDLKKKEVEKRIEVKEKAWEKLEESKEKGDVVEMQKYAKMATFLTSDMIEQAKELIDALGLPIVQAPSEGEAQASYIVKKGQAYAASTQDYDALMFGCPLVVRNLAITGKRKVPGKDIYAEVSPELIKLSEVLDHLGIDQDQLIILAILVGTDFNPGGVKNIGPKKALDLVKKYGKNYDLIFKQVEWDKQYPDLDWKDLYGFIKNAPVTDDYEIKFRPIDKEKVKRLLVDKFEFSEERVDNALEKAEKGLNLRQTDLSQFFKKK